MRRKRVDWDEELRKTEAIRRRGFRISAMGFVLGMAFLVGATRFNGELPFWRYFIQGVCFITAFAILIFLVWRRAKKRDQEDE